MHKTGKNIYREFKFPLIGEPIFISKNLRLMLPD